MPLRIHTTEAGWEHVLLAELNQVFPASSHRGLEPGWVESRLSGEDDARPVCVAFAAQCLSDALPLSASSVSKWALEAGGRLIDGLRSHAGPWRLHVFCVPRPDAPVTTARCRLIDEAIVELLRKKQRRLLRARTADPAAPWSDDEAFVQVGLRTATKGYLSIVHAERRRVLRRTLSRFPGGVVEVVPNRQAPSRAFAKLAEVELRLGRQIGAGETCVDLGSSPGSWAWLALSRGASVTSIDRSPLDASLMRHPRLKFVRGDAFRYQPPQPVDWLLCDVIAFPARTLQLLQTWLTHRWCRWFCVTVKFRGRDEHCWLEEFKTWLASSGAEFEIRRLSSNKNEVTTYGHLTGGA